MDELEKAVDILKSAVAGFPIGASTIDDFKPIEDKIVDLRECLKSMNARRLTLKAIIQCSESDSQPLDKSFEKLNESIMHHLLNSKALKLCHHSRALQDIVYKNYGSTEIQVKVKACLSKLHTTNDKLTSMKEEKKELMKKQYQLKLECHHALYNYQDFLKEREIKRNEKLNESNPTRIKNKENLDKVISKIYTMKKLITNLISPMCHMLEDNEELVDMLSKHKHTVTLETIKELTKNVSLSDE